jgi:hypothetical protein
MRGHVSLRIFYKINGEEGIWGSHLEKYLLCGQNFYELVYLLRVGFQNLVKSGSPSL